MARLLWRNWAGSLIFYISLYNPVSRQSKGSFTAKILGRQRWDMRTLWSLGFKIKWKPVISSPHPCCASSQRKFPRPPALTAPMPSLFPSDAHIYSELPASVRSERGLPRESGLVLRSPECPSGGKVPTLTWPFLSCLSRQLAHGPAHTSSIHVFILHIHTHIMCVHTCLWDSTDE